MALRSYITVVLAALLALVVVGAASAPEATANACAASCRADHNQCRVKTRSLDSSSCDARLQQCLQRCLKR